MLSYEDIMSSRFDWKIGKSLHFGENFCDEVDKLVEAGFDSIDFDLCKFWTDRQKEVALYESLETGLEKIRESGLYFNAVHISFGPNWDISNRDEEKRLRVVDQIKEIIERCDKFNPHTYVIHGSYGKIEDAMRQDRIRQLKRSLTEIRELTKAHISLETLTAWGLGNTSDEIISIVDDVDGIDVCVDVNHFLQEKCEDAIKKIAHRIRTVHISDHDYITEKHWMPGEGKIDWQATICALEDVNYLGSWTYELGISPTKTIDRPRNFSYADFINNARELFNNEEITVIGKPIK